MLKSILTLGTVKFTTVQVPVPVVLTEDGLHLFQLDADEKVKGHFLFDNERLSHAKLTKAPQTKIPEELGNSAKFYTLSIPTDGDTKELSLCTILYPTQQTFLGYSHYRRLLAFATGQHFFKTLGAKFAQLNVL